MWFCKGAPSKVNHMCKGPEVGMSLMCPGNSKEANRLSRVGGGVEDEATKDVQARVIL